MAASRFAGIFRAAEGFGKFGRPAGVRTASSGFTGSGPEPVDETRQIHRQGAIGRPESQSADTLPAGDAEQFDD